MAPPTATVSCFGSGCANTVLAAAKARNTVVLIYESSYLRNVAGRTRRVSGEPSRRMLRSAANANPVGNAPGANIASAGMAISIVGCASSVEALAGTADPECARRRTGETCAGTGGCFTYAIAGAGPASLGWGSGANGSGRSIHRVRAAATAPKPASETVMARRDHFGVTTGRSKYAAKAVLTSQ